MHKFVSYLVLSLPFKVLSKERTEGPAFDALLASNDETHTPDTLRVHSRSGSRQAPALAMPCGILPKAQLQRRRNACNISD